MNQILYKGKVYGGVGEDVTNKSYGNITVTNPVTSQTSTFNNVVGGVNSEIFNIYSGENKNVAAGTCSTVIGSGNKEVGAGYFNFVSGWNNTLVTTGVVGEPPIIGSVVGGSNNILYAAGSDNAVFGTDNKVLGQHTNFCAGDQNTISTGVHNAVFGSQNTCKGNANFIIGQSNAITTSAYDTIIGGIENSSVSSEHSLITGSQNTISTSDIDSVICGNENTFGTVYQSLASGDKNSCNSVHQSILAGNNDTISDLTQSVACASSLSAGYITQSFVTGSSLNITNSNYGIISVQNTNQLLGNIYKSLVIGNSLTYNSTDRATTNSIISGDTISIIGDVTGSLIVGKNCTIGKVTNGLVIGNMHQVNPMNNSTQTYTIGEGLINQSADTFVIGKYNEAKNPSGDFTLIIGNGVDINNRSDCLQINKDGSQIITLKDKTLSSTLGIGKVEITQESIKFTSLKDNLSNEKEVVEFSFEELQSLKALSGTQLINNTQFPQS